MITTQRYIVQFNTAFEPESILAIAAGNASAHTIAEALSYSKNHNAMYGLFKIRIMSRKELFAAKDGRWLLDLFLQDK